MKYERASRIISDILPPPPPTHTHTHFHYRDKAGLRRPVTSYAGGGGGGTLGFTTSSRRGHHWPLPRLVMGPNNKDKTPYVEQKYLDRDLD